MHTVLHIFTALHITAAVTNDSCGDAGSEIHLSPTDLASPLPAQVKPEQFAQHSFWRNRDWARVPTILRWTKTDDRNDVLGVAEVKESAFRESR
jgi:hypothetical protein